VKKIIACTPKQCVCARCGDNTELIGYETSEQLDVEPAKFRKLKSFNVGALTQLFNPFLNSTLPGG
jgi:hypothetical protein